MIEPLAAVRAVHFAATAITAGMLTFEVLVARPALRAVPDAGEVASSLRIRIERWAFIGLALSLISGVFWLMLEAGQMSGLGVTMALTQGAIWTVLTSTTFGIASDIRAGLMVAIVSTLPLIRGAGKLRPIPPVLAGALLGTLAWTGHAIATPGPAGDLHLIADVLHLLASGVWIGSLVPLALVFAMGRQGGQAQMQFAQVATALFSRLGIVSVGTLVVTGIVNAWMLAGSVPALVGTDYGLLLLAKIALFLVMVGLAAANRLRLTPKLSAAGGRQANALRQIGRNALIELALGLVIFSIVGALGILEPGLHVQPEWPFRFRFDPAPFVAPSSWRTVLALAATLTGVALVIGGLFWREFRWPMIVGGTVVAANFASGISVLLVEAYPTTFYASPTGFSTGSIAQGAALFGQHCSPCHGTAGRGDGPAAARSRRRPADLTADHVYAHTDGDMFWWITRGIDDVMPGFARVAPDDASWNLIDFIHANADAKRLRASPGVAGSLGYRAPGFSAECPDGSSVANDDLRGRVIHIVNASSIDTGQLPQILARGKLADVSTIVVAPASSHVPSTSACVSADPSLLDVLALYSGTDTAQSVGMELLIDPAGSLRAVWFPGVNPDWTDARTFGEIVKDIRRRPAATSTASHVHG